MCGFIGQISHESINHEKLIQQNKKIICRGPDEMKKLSGNFSEFNRNIDIEYSFIFNRLSIVDLSPKASQPMFSKKFNSMILFNGEIYNHFELRKKLEDDGVEFFTDHSDTEVLLIGLSKYGVKFISDLVGQFAIAFFDFNIRKLFLIRDRIGQKPLYYHTQKNLISFSSNLKSLANIIDGTTVDFNSVEEYLSIGVVTSPMTIFKNIYKVNPGELIEFDLNNNFKIKSSEIYWEISSFVENNKFDKEVFYEKFNEAVNLRREADVEVATLLSGGIDSTSIVKSMSNFSEKVNTFSIGYEDKKYDEQKWIDQVANKFSTNHITEKITESEIEDYIFNSIDFLDEPYSDPSTVPSYAISRKISEYYKVALTGDGGDELLAGYVRTQKILNNIKFNPNFIKILLDAYPWYLGTGNKISRHSSDLNFNYSSYFLDSKFVSKLKTNKSFSSSYLKFKNNNPNIKDFMLVDFKLYLSEMMMLKVDKMFMANSVEGRSPFVDHKLIEYCLSCNLDILKGNPKIVLKEYLISDFDEKFLNRKKMGFVFNLEKWVYENINSIDDYFHNNMYLSEIFDKELFEKLKMRKSKTNALRIWKLFILEKYIQDYFFNKYK